MTPKGRGFLRSLLFCALPKPQAKYRDEILKCSPTNDADWAEWLKCVRHNRIETQVVRWIEALEWPVPDDVFAVLKKRAREIQSQTQSRWSAGLPLLEEARRRGLDVVVLKGNAMAEDVYGDAAYKQMNDLDLLIREKDRDAWWALLEERKLPSAGSLEKDPRSQEKYSHHWAPFFTTDFRCVYGFHWNLISPLRREKIATADLWSRSQAIRIQGFDAHRLGAADFLLHLCVHLSPYKLGLRELGDVVAWIDARKNELSVTDFVSEVEAASAVDGACRAFALIDSLFEDDFVDAVLKRLRPWASRTVKAELSRRLRDPMDFLWSRTTQLSKIEKAYALFRLSEHPVEKTVLLTKMWKHYLWPKMADARRLDFRPTERDFLSGLRARMIAPWLISRAFAAELGWSVFLIVTLRHEVECLASWVNALTLRAQGRRPIALEDRARAWGRSLDEIRQVAFLE